MKRRTATFCLEFFYFFCEAGVTPRGGVQAVQCITCSSPHFFRRFVFDACSARAQRLVSRFGGVQFSILQNRPNHFQKTRNFFNIGKSINLPTNSCIFKVHEQYNSRLPRHCLKRDTMLDSGRLLAACWRASVVEWAASGSPSRELGLDVTAFARPVASFPCFARFLVLSLDLSSTFQILVVNRYADSQRPLAFFHSHYITE